MTPRKLEVGDSIRIYGFDCDDAAQVRTRKIDRIQDDGLILTDGGEICHPKQVRRLKLRAKARTVFISENNLARVMQDALSVPVWKDKPSLSGMVEFREVRRRK